MKNERSTLVLVIIIATLKRLHKAITNFTEAWITAAKSYKNYLSHLVAFKRQHEMYESADSLQKSVWVFAALIFIPVLAIIDSATLHLFFEFLGGKVTGPVKDFLAQDGFIIFIVIELMAAVFYIFYAKKRDEGEGSIWGIIAIIILIMVLTIFPSTLILGGNYLQSDKSIGDLVKVSALVVFSLVVHFSIFLFSEILWHSLVFIWYAAKSLWFDITNPKRKLAKLSLRLRKLHLDYKHNLNEYLTLPAKDQAGFDPELGIRESWLMNKLSNFNEDDFDLEDIDPSPIITPPDTGGGRPGSGSALPTNEGRIGFRYTYTDTTQ